MSASPTSPINRGAVSVGNQRYRQARMASEEDGSRDRGRSVAAADFVEGGVEEKAVVSLEREAELDREVVFEIRDGDADQRQAALFDQRRRGREQGACGVENRRCAGGRVGEGVRAGRARV